MTINERMFSIMAQKGIKDIELVRHLHKTTSLISTWKTRGTNPPADCIIQICELLQISPHYLLTGEEAPELLPEEQKLLEAFRSADAGTQSIVRKILDIPEKSKLSNSEAGKKIS